MRSGSTVFAGVMAAVLAAPSLARDTSVVTPLPQFTAADTQLLFVQDTVPMQLAALSSQEMKETEGALINFAVGGVSGFVIYVGGQLISRRSITRAGSLYSIATGAVTGGVGGALIRASGGGIAGNLAWRPNMVAAGFAFAQYRNYRGW